MNSLSNDGSSQTRDATSQASHGKSRVREFFIGSVTNYCLHRCKKPVVIFRSPPTIDAKDPNAQGPKAVQDPNAQDQKAARDSDAQGPNAVQDPNVLGEKGMAKGAGADKNGNKGAEQQHVHAE